MPSDSPGNMASSQDLRRLGWHLSEDGLKECTSNGKNTVDDVIKTALNLDLRHIGERHLPEGINRSKSETFDGPFVVQIVKIRNITAPKENEESQAAPPMLKVTFTDGHTNCNGVEMDKINKLGLQTPPGTKVLIRAHVSLSHGFLMLTNDTMKVLGGHVPKLVENWELKRTLAKHTRDMVSTDGGGPPPFVPFGQRYREANTRDMRPKKDNFKSLVEKEKDKKEKEEDKEFEAQRQAQIAEALQSKGGEKKTFVNAFKPNDKSVASIVEMGFSADQAGAALKQTSGNVESAINFLLTGGVQQQRGPRRDDRVADLPGRGGRGGGGRGGRGRGDRDRGDRDRGDRDYDQEDDGRRGRGRRRDEEDCRETRPSGPATLFDFLTTKFPSGKGDSSGSTQPSQGPQAAVTDDRNKGLQNLPPRLQKQQQQREDVKPTRGGRGGGGGNDWSNEGQEYRGGGGRGGRGERGGRADRGGRSDRGRGGGGGTGPRGHNQNSNTWSANADNQGPSNKPPQSRDNRRNDNRDNHRNQDENRDPRRNQDHEGRGGNRRNQEYDGRGSNRRNQDHDGRGRNQRHQDYDGRGDRENRRNQDYDGRGENRRNQDYDGRGDSRGNQDYDNRGENRRNQEFDGRDKHRNQDYDGKDNRRNQEYEHRENRGQGGNQPRRGGPREHGERNSGQGWDGAQNSRNHGGPIEQNQSDGRGKRNQGYQQQQQQQHQQPAQHHQRNDQWQGYDQRTGNQGARQERGQYQQYNNQDMGHADTNQNSRGGGGRGNQRNDQRQQHQQQSRNQNQQSQQQYQQQQQQPQQQQQRKQQQPQQQQPQQQQGRPDSNYNPAVDDVRPTYVDQPQQTTNSEGERSTRQWKAGDACMAKYWEDNQFYRAQIHAIAPNGHTCVLTFSDYGNAEEVFLTDIRPAPKHAWDGNNAMTSNAGVVSMTVAQQPYPPPTVVSAPTAPMMVAPSMQYTSHMYPTDQPYQQEIAGLEFHAGGGGVAYSSQAQHRRMPQEIYVPPGQRRM